MCGRLQRTSLVLLAVVLGAAPATAQQKSGWKAGKDWCERVAPGEQESTFDKSVIVIDHRESRVICPVARPLKVKDGEPIRVIFDQTAPDTFSYAISAIEVPATPRGVGATVGREAIPVERLLFTSLALRHDRHFSQYKIAITPRADLVEVEEEEAAEVDETVEKVLALEASLPEAQRVEVSAAIAEEVETMSDPVAEQIQAEVVDELDDYTQWLTAPEIRQLTREISEEVEDVLEERVILRPFETTIEVETAGPELTFTSGFSFSDLTSPKFFLASNDAGTPAAAEDDFKTVELDPNEAEDVEPDVMALINIRWPELKNRSWFWNKLGVAFGLGLNGDSEPRYFLGPSFTLPKGFVFTAGLSGGKVKVLPVGQELGEIPINGDNTLGSLGSRFKVGYHFGISFAFTDRETEVRSHLNGLQAVNPGTPAPAPTPAPTPGSGDDDDEDEDDEDDEDEDDENRDGGDEDDEGDGR